MQYSVWLVILLLAMSLTLHQNIAETIPFPTIVPTTNIDTSANSSIYPTVNSSIYPTVNSSIYPTVNSSIYPTINSSIYPTADLSIYPTVNSSIYPTINSSIYPTINSSIYPTINSSIYPTVNSSIYPTVNSSIYPTVNSSIYPTIKSSIYPTASPAVNPSIDQTDLTASPTVMPSCTSGEPSTASSPSVETSHSPTTFSSVMFYITQYINNCHYDKYVLVKDDSDKVIRKAIAYCMTGPMEDDIKDLRVTSADNRDSSAAVVTKESGSGASLKLDYTVIYSGYNANYTSLSIELKNNVQKNESFDKALKQYSQQVESVKDVFSSAHAGYITVSKNPTVVTDSGSSSSVSGATIAGLVIVFIIAVVIVVLIARNKCCNNDSSYSRSSFSSANIEMSTSSNRSNKQSLGQNGYSNVSAWDIDDEEESDLIGLKESTPKKSTPHRRL